MKDFIITASMEILMFVIKQGMKWAESKLSDQEYRQEHAKLVKDTIEPKVDKIRKQIQEQHAVQLKTATTLYGQALELFKVTDPRKVRTRGSGTTDSEFEGSLPQEIAELLRQSFKCAIQAFYGNNNLPVKERILAIQFAMACIGLLHDHEPMEMVARWKYLIEETVFADVAILQSLRANLENSGNGNKGDLESLEVMATDIFGQLEILKYKCSPEQLTQICAAMKSLVRPPIKMSETGYLRWGKKLTLRRKSLETMSFTPQFITINTVVPTDDGSVILLMSNAERELLLCKLDRNLDEVYSHVVDANPSCEIMVKGSLVYAVLLDDALHWFDHENHFDEVGEPIPLQSEMDQTMYDDYVNRRPDYRLILVAPEQGHILYSWFNRCSQNGSLSAYSTSETELRIGVCVDEKACLMTGTETDNEWSVGVESEFTFDGYHLCTFDEKGRFLMMNKSKDEFAFLKLDGSEGERKLYKHELHRYSHKAIYEFKVKRDTVWLVDDEENIERHQLVDLMEGAIEL